MADDTNIPVIDISGLDAEPSTELSVARQIREACVDRGFFYLTGHGIAAEMLADVFASNREFHARPDVEKLEIKLNTWHRGYQAFATSTLVSSERFAPARTANQLESFILRHEVSPDDPGYRKHELMGPNQWPANPAFKANVSRYDEAVRELGSRLLSLIALAVGENRDFFGQFFNPASTALRLIHYPPAAEDRAADEFGIHPHTDYGFITILAQDDVGGLEIQTTDGGWTPAPSIPGSLVVNIGDILARWTNDVFNSTPHRVINNSTTRERYSIAMFFDPNIEAEIRGLEKFCDEQSPAKYPAIRYGDYYRHRLDNNYPDRTNDQT